MYRQLQEEEDLVWQYRLYQKIPALRVIRITDNSNNCNADATRLETNSGRSAEDILKFGKKLDIDSLDSSNDASEMDWEEYFG